MRKFINSFLIIWIYILITACPYESSVSLKSPSEKFIPDLIGKWILQNGKGDYAIIKKLNNYQYQINNNKYDDHETIKYISKDYRAHTSTLDNDIFLNISPVDSEKETYFIYKKTIITK